MEKDVLTETPDLAMLDYVLMCPYLREEDALGLFQYRKLALDNDGKVDVEYAQTTYDGMPYGRRYPRTGAIKTCTNMWAPVRAALFGDTETDIDIKCCGCTILRNTCYSYDIECPILEDFVSDRSKYIDDLVFTDSDVEHYNNVNNCVWTREDYGKHIFTALLYGAKTTNLAKQLDKPDGKCPVKNKGIAREFVKEISKLATAIVNQPTVSKPLTAIKEFLNKSKATKDPSDSKLLSYFLFEQERIIIDTARCLAKKHDLDVSCSIYDGFQIRCRDQARIDAFLQECNEQTGVIFVA